MEIIKKLFKNRLFWAGLFIPLIFQLVYFSIAIPAIKDGNTGIKNLKVAVVNEDPGIGSEVAAQLIQSLPFKVEASSDLSGALDSMNDGSYNMVIHIAGDFTDQIQQGNAQISYYINQAAPSMTKQLMERTVISINQALNEISFATIKNSIQQSSVNALSQSGLPASATVLIGANLGKAFDSLKYTTIKSDIQKVNNSDGFIQTVLPFFIFLTYFVGCILMTILHIFSFKGVENQYAGWKIFLVRLGTNIAASVIIPCIVIGAAAAFNIPLSVGTLTAWLVLAIGFFTMLSMVQMFSNWFGLPGMGIALVILFPLQLVSSGLIYSREVLPSFYTAISNYLPSTYFGNGMLKIFYGGPSVTGETGILLMMSVIFIIISALTLLKRGKDNRADAVNA